MAKKMAKMAKNGSNAVQCKSHLEPSEKALKKTKSEELAILRRYTPSWEFVCPFWPFFGPFQTVKCDFLKILQCPDFANLWGDFWHLSQPIKLDESDGGFSFLRIIFLSHVLCNWCPGSWCRYAPINHPNQIRSPVRKNLPRHLLEEPLTLSDKYWVVVFL